MQAWIIKIKKYYFNIFLNKKSFKKQLLKNISQLHKKKKKGVN
jgi:hypothetical protein